jgi:hypothetical protein
MTTPREVLGLVDRIRPLLAGYPAEMQGAALADLLAIWLAGHYVEGDAVATRTLRSDLLADHFTTVIQLTPLNAKTIGTTE